MQQAAFDYTVLIGRFQPPHLAHMALLERALQLAGQAIVVLGETSDGRRSLKNPFTVAERAQMLQDSLATAMQGRVHICAVRDTDDDAAWVQAVESAVMQTIDRIHAGLPSKGSRQPRVALLGHQKDASSYYLQLFPRWPLVDAPNLNGLNATDIRKHYFGVAHAQDYMTALPAGSQQFLTRFQQEEAFAQLRAMHAKAN